MADMLFHVYCFAVMTTVLYFSSCASKRARGIPKHHIRVLDDIISTYIDSSSIYQNSTVDLILGGYVQNPDIIMDNQDINTLDHRALKNIIEVTKNRITNDNDRLLNNTRKFRHKTDIVKVLGYPPVPYEAAYAIGKSFEMMKQSIYATKFRLTETNELRRKYRIDPVFNMAILAGNIHQIVMKCDNLLGQMLNLPENTHFIHYLIMYEKILAGHVDVTYLTQRAFLYDKLAQQLIKGEDEEGDEKRERPRRKPKGFSKAYGAPKDEKPEPAGGNPADYKGNEQYAQRPKGTTKTTSLKPKPP